MRLAALGFMVVLLCIGCHGLGTGRFMSANQCPMGCPGPCEHQPCPPPAPCPVPCPPKQCEKPRDVQPRPAPPPEQPGQRAVTQDVLLIPRMVYVPYAPHVPVTPARLGTVAPGEREIKREPEKKRDVEPPQKRDVCPPEGDKTSECLDKICEFLNNLNQRIDYLEKQHRAPCPAPNIYCPTPEAIGPPGSINHLPQPQE